MKMTKRIGEPAEELIVILPHPLLLGIAHIPAGLALWGLQALRDAKRKTFTFSYFQHLRAIALRLAAIAMKHYHKGLSGRSEAGTYM